MPSAGTGESEGRHARFGPRRGEYLGRYQILERIGSGGTSSVYLAADRRLRHAVALKILELDGERARRLFEEEAMTTAQCHDEHIAAIHDLLELDGRTLMVLEYVPGPTLSTLLTSAGPLTLQLAASITRGLLSALARVHEAGFVHCDVKPANIVVGPGHSPKLLDFGIAQRACRRASHDGARAHDVAPLRFTDTTDPAGLSGPRGTMHYMAPEQWDVPSLYDARMDLWAVGLLIFEMLSGQHPLLFARQGRAGGLHPSVVAIPRLEDAVPGAPRGLADVVASCLERDSSRRATSARSLLRALEAIEAAGH